jgi:hypothetical protein
MLALVIAQHYPGEGQSGKKLCVLSVPRSSSCEVLKFAIHKYISKRYVDAEN